MIRKIKKAFLKRYGEIQKKHNKNVKKFDKLNLNSTYTFCSEHCAIRSNMALIESRSGEDLAGNMLRIAQGLQERNVKVYISVKEDSEEKIRAIARKAGLIKAKFVTIHTCRYYRILATAKYLFNDVSFTWRFIKRDDQVYTNTWHGTPLKCLGYDVPGDQYIMGNGQRNLLMADYLAVPNSFCGEHLIDAYHIRNLYHGKVLYSGYPRNQIFFDNEARARVRRELGLEQKKVYAYMPTWRGNHTEASDDFLPVLTAMLDSLDTGFSDEQILYVKLHNLTKSQLDLSGYRHIREFPAEYETYEFLNIADCLITDYSSVLFDFANTGAGIVLYVPDKEEYLRERGMYLSLDALPFPQAGTAEELLTALNSWREIRYPEFAATYCAYDNGNCTNRLLDHVMGIARTYEEETLPKPEKRNVMIFCSNVQIQDPITASLKNLLENLDSARFNYYFGFYRKNTPAECEFFRNVPKDISIFSISSPFYLTFIEQWAYDLQQKKHVFKKPVQKVLDRLYRRELKKLLVDAPFDVIVHFDGYGTQDTLPMFQQYPKKRIVLAHNNMKAKKHKRSKPDKAILKSAYSHYDQIVAVTPEAAKSVAALGAPKKKTVLLQGLSETGDSLKSAVMEFETLLMEDTMKEDILPAFPERNIPIVFSANDQFVPIMATMILSIAENASAQNNYDILIMTRDISSDSENKLRQMLAPFANFSLRICNVSEYIQGYDLYTENRKSISVETYFRLVLPELLPMYDKVLYLDGDMVAATDVAQLYETDIQDYLVASCRDADGIGRCYKPGETRREYRENTLKIQNLDDYFCAGTLLMNLDRFRKELPTKKLLEFASSYPWQWHDQDVLNALCQGKTLMVDMSWGLMRDAGNNHYMPEALYKEFLEAEKDPKIIHYGGTRKPWLYLDVVRGEYFWKYAVRTPFYQEILALVQKGKKEKKSKTIDPKKAKDVVLKQFQKGEIGFDYLRKYFGAWLHRVFKRSK